jgi:virulence-associated protein VagC
MQVSTGAKPDEFGGRANINLVAAAPRLEIPDVSGNQSVRLPSNRDFEEGQVTCIRQHYRETFAPNGLSARLNEGEDCVNICGVEPKHRTVQNGPVFAENAIIVQHGEGLGEACLDDASRRAVRVDHA